MSIFGQGHSDGDFSAFRQGQGQQFSLTGRRHNPLTLDINRGILRRLSSEIGWVVPSGISNIDIPRKNLIKNVKF